MTDGPATPAYDRTERRGSAALVLALAVALVGVMAAFFVAPSSSTPRLMILALALFAVAGVFFLFAYAVGILQFAGRAARNDVTKLIADTCGECLLVTEGDTQVAYANQAYMTLCGARDSSGIVIVERLFSGPPEVSEAIYRLSQAARTGLAHIEDLRLSPPLTGAGRRGLVSHSRAAAAPPLGARLALGRRRCDGRSRAAGERLSGTPARDRLSRSRAGRLLLGGAGRRHSLHEQDARRLARLRPHPGRLRRAHAARHCRQQWRGLARGDRRARRARCAREEIDLDFRRRNGRSLPVRLLHRVAFGQDGAPGASRTLVLNRDRVAASSPRRDLRAAEVRFARFFNSTPMAIATLDGDGRVLRSNAAFAKMFPQALKDAQAKGEGGCLAAPCRHGRARPRRAPGRDRRRARQTGATRRRSMSASRKARGRARRGSSCRPPRTPARRAR